MALFQVTARCEGLPCPGLPHCWPRAELEGRTNECTHARLRPACGLPACSPCVCASEQDNRAATAPQPQEVSRGLSEVELVGGHKGRGVQQHLQSRATQ